MTEFVTNQDAKVVIEFTPKTGIQQVALSADDIIKKSSLALDSAMNAINHMCRRVSTTIDSLAKRPSKVEVEFSLKFDAEAGVVISRGGVEAGLKIKLVWGE